MILSQKKIEEIGRNSDFHPQQRALHERVAVPDWYSDTKPYLSGENRIFFVCKELSVGTPDSFGDGSGNQPV